MPTAVPPTRHAPSHPLDGLTVLERGWLSSNNLLVHAAPGEDGALLVDSGHVNHAAQTLALVQQALQGTPLTRLVNTHLHSDHCGGNASLQRAHGVVVAIPPGQADAIAAWDDAALSYAATGQRIEAFRHQQLLQPGEPLVAGGVEWQVLAAPGHDPHSVMLFEPRRGLLVSADALWEHGFGVVFPEVQGEPGFDDVGQVLDQIAALPVKLVVPGHGAPFTDVAAALARARARLAAFRADPAKHARHALKVLVKYHLMEERQQPLAALLDWAEATPLVQTSGRLHPPPAAAGGTRAWLQGLVMELVDSGALARDGDLVLDR
jgi:glyoxylase-like metal-dependent hydrolase (beta-lactamase superfamily II)